MKSASSELKSSQVILKFHALLFSASFKERGAFNKLTQPSKEEKWQY